jgi:HSP20 family protein
MTLVKFRNPRMMFFDQMFGNENFSATNTTLPSVNIKEDHDQFSVELAAPGFSKSDFNIELNNNVLTISSDKKIENETKEGENFSRKEFSYQSFSRSFSLPNTIDEEQIKAQYENGILILTLPKKDEAKPKPAIQINIE